MKQINLASDFYPHLTNRDENQGDGQHTGVEFREQFLNELESEEWWKDDSKKIEINLEGVTTLGPSWTNEVFAFFTQYNVSPERILKKIIFHNGGRIKDIIIKQELKTGYSR